MKNSKFSIWRNCNLKLLCVMEKLEEKQRESLQRIKCENKRIFFSDRAMGNEENPRDLFVFAFGFLMIIWENSMRELEKKSNRKYLVRLESMGQVRLWTFLKNISNKLVIRTKFLGTKVFGFRLLGFSMWRLQNIKRYLGS